MEEEEDQLQLIPYTFWGVSIGPNKTIPVNYDENAYLTISNACIGEFPEDLKPNERNIVSLHCKTVDMEKYDEKTQEAPTVDTEIQLCTLIPEHNEHLNLSHVLSPLSSEIKITNKGPCTVYLSGYFAFIEDEPLLYG